MLPEFEIAAQFLPILFDTYPREKDEEEKVMRERKSGRRGEGAGYSDKIYVNGIGDTKLRCDDNLISNILWTWQVNVDSREAELSWLGTWLVYFLVATVEIIISAANTTFNQVRIL